MTKNEKLMLDTLKRVYLQLEVMSLGNASAAIATELSRATLRDTIAKIGKDTPEVVQHRFEEQARTELEKIKKMK